MNSKGRIGFSKGGIGICDRCHKEYGRATPGADGLCPSCAAGQVIDTATAAVKAADFKWTVPASEGACRALLDHARLINPDVLIMAQGAAIQRAYDEKRAGSIIRADVEQAIIANQSAAMTAQANRIRDLESIQVLLIRACCGVVEDITRAGLQHTIPLTLSVLNAAIQKARGE